MSAKIKEDLCLGVTKTAETGWGRHIPYPSEAVIVVSCYSLLVLLTTCWIAKSPALICLFCLYCL